MGCGGSSNSDSKDVPSDWVTVVLNVETGDMTRSSGSSEKESLAKFTLEKKPAVSKVSRLHFVEQKIGGTWDEKTFGGKVKFLCLDQKEMSELWKKVGPTKDDGSRVSEVMDSAGTSSMSSMNSLAGPTKASKSHAVNGKAEYSCCQAWTTNGKDKVFLMTGEVNDTVNVIDQESGEVVLSLWQKLGGLEMKFYDRLIAKKSGFRTSIVPAEQELMDNSYCGLRARHVENNNEVHLQINPKVLDKIPVSLFAMAILYSSQELTNMDL